MNPSTGRSDNAGQVREEMLQLLRLQHGLPAFSASFGHQSSYPRQPSLSCLQSNHLLHLQPSTLSLAAALNPGWLSHGLSLTSVPIPSQQFGSSLALTESLMRQLPSSLSHLHQMEQLAIPVIRSHQLRSPEATLSAAAQSLTDRSTITSAGVEEFAAKRDPVNTFASRLFEILSNPENAPYISWLPHGRAWRILDKARFERDVIPLHFRHARYASFMRQVRLSLLPCRLVQYIRNNCHGSK